jgi:NAD(P)H dehydrogenase (quinone)
VEPGIFEGECASTKGENNQMIVVSGGGGFGASATTGPDSPGVDEKELASARDLGRRVAEVAGVVRRGSRP